ncbi:MAG: LysM peptidoglycan-binding domain-containing protein, partial [Gammaproteobacteria bacterium]|nr:LysM peptidoglycan-binding domain-containing protein [Gammaproteobacteria bacterium]
MSSHDKSLVVEFSFSALGGFSASLQEAIKTYMPEIQSQMATRFTGTKLAVIGTTGDIIKVGISYQSGDPNQIGKAYFELFGGLIGGTAGAWGGAALGPIGRVLGAGVGSVGGGLGGSYLGGLLWNEIQNTGAGNWLKTNIPLMGDLGVRVYDNPALVQPSFPNPADLPKIFLLPYGNNIEIARLAPDGQSVIRPGGQMLTRDPNASSGNYTVRPGDNLWTIGRNNGLSQAQMEAANPQITHPSLIHPGQVINVPTKAPDNSRLTVSTFTTPVSQRTGLENVEQMGSWVTQGYAYYGTNSRVSMPLDTLNGNGLWNTGMSGVVTDWLRPGNGNLSSSSMLGVFDEGPIDIFAPDPFGINFTSRPILFGSLNNLNLGANLFINIDPLVLDLNGDGVKLTDYGSNPVLFDIDNDGGSQEVTGWVSPQDGILVMD